MLQWRFAVGMLPVALMGLGPDVVSGQDFPNKVIRILTSPAGGGGDFIARVIAPGISSRLGQPVIVDNQRSAVIAAEVVSKAPPDGYTLTAAGGSVWTQPLFRKVPYDVMRDFSAISLLVREVSVVAVHPSVPVKSIKELIALAKARPGELNYGSANIGSPAHLAPELFKSMAGVNIVRVDFKGLAPALTSQISGEVQMTIVTASVVMPHVKSGRLRALAVTSAEPTMLAPGLPTVAAALPGYESTSLTGILAPAKTPEAIINRLNQELERVLNLPDLKERFLNSGAEVVGGSPERFAAALKSDIAVIGKVIKDAGIKADN